MSNLAKILQKHDGTDAFNAKVLQAAGRWASKQSAYNLIADGSEYYEHLRDLLRRLEKAGAGPVVHDILNDLCEELDYRVTPKAAEESNVEPLRASCETMRVFATFTEALLRALSDGRLSEQEEGALVEMLNTIDRASAEIREALKKHRPRVRAAS